MHRGSYHDISPCWRGTVLHGIHATERIMLLLVAFTAMLAAAAQRLQVPYPILLVIGGLVLSLIPVFPDISLDPTLIFLVVLPPLLYSAALQTAWREFRHKLVHILLLAFGLVAFTVAGVAVAVHLVIRDFDLESGVLLGAVVCTTDAIAASAIGRRVGLPHEMLELIEGESLINDAAGLLALQFSIGLVASKTIPTFSSGAAELTLLVVGGVGAGLFVGFLVQLFQRPAQGSALQTLVSLATPYFAYLLAESLHSSGVLATVVCGLYIGQRNSDVLTSEARLQSYAVWDTIEFGLNGIVFMLIGLQLPHVLDGLRPLHWGELLGGAAFISALLIALRMAWVYPAERVARRIEKRFSSMAPEPLDNRKTFIVGWAGMRGVLTLAAALSLPETTDTGAPFPHRAAILFLAFAAILVSLTGQGLSLPWMIRKLKVAASPHALQDERNARRLLTEAALKTISSMQKREGSEAEEIAEIEAAADIMERYYRQRLAAVSGGDKQEASASAQQAAHAQLAAKLRQVERGELLRLEHQGEIGGEALRKLERELDLLDLRWRSGN